MACYYGASGFDLIMISINGIKLILFMLHISSTWMSKFSRNTPCTKCRQRSSIAKDNLICVSEPQSFIYLISCQIDGPCADKSHAVTLCFLSSIWYLYYSYLSLSIVKVFFP